MAITSGYSAEDLARLGPDALTRRRMLAEALLAKSAGQRKIEHPLQGAAQMAEALVNGLRVRKLDQAETTGIKSGESAWESLFGGSSGASSTAETAPVTMPGAAAEMSGTSPGRISPSGSTGIQISSSPDATELNALLGDPAKRSGLPAGMRNNNPGNIKFVGQKVPGIVGPSVNTDQGDPQAVFDTPESGMQAMYSLLNKKYSGGKVTPNQIIAGNMGWTPGNYDAARNVARSMGIGPDDDIGFSDPARAAKFMRGLILQEHGKSGGLYPESMILSAIGGRAPNQVASLDPAIGMPPQAAPPQMPPAASAYVDPMVSAPNSQPQQMAAIPPAGGMPPLEPPRTIGTPAVPPNAPPPQQLAQALTGNSAPPQRQGPSVQDLAKIIANPWVSDDKKKIAQVLLGQQLEQNDPLKKMQLEKGQLEIDQMRNPRLSPADQARLDMERQKLEFDRSKPTEVNGRLVGPDGKIVYEGGLSAEQDARLKLDREKFEAEKAKGQWQKLTDGRLYNETTGEFKDAPPPAPGSVPPKFDDISSVRKEIQQLPAYKNMAQAAPIYKSMVETAGRNTRASDLNLVYGLGKIMDPTSVVREGEMVMVKNTASLPDWLVGAANALNGGAALQPETRKAIMTEAFGRMKGYSDEFEKNTGQYKGIAQRFNMNPDDVIPPFEQFQPWDGVADTPSSASPSAPADGMKKTTTGIPWRPIQ